MSEETHHIDIEASPPRVVEAVAFVAEGWGAEWLPGSGGGQLHLPVVAGLRRGLLSGQLEIRPSGSNGTRLTLRAEASHWRVHRSAAAVLVLGALGALPVLLWPVNSQFLALAPVGLVFMFIAWFMVVSRLRTAGGSEFLDAVHECLQAAEPPG